MENFYYVYVLRSLKDGRNYTGFTHNIQERLIQHNTGKVTSTKHRIPFELVYFEASKCIDDATHREKYLKTTYGKRYIKTRLQHYLNPKIDIS